MSFNGVNMVLAIDILFEEMIYAAMFITVF